MGTRSLSLGELITQLAGDRQILDRPFARALAAALHQRGPQIALPDIEAMGLTDVMVTFSMDKEMAVVITGTPPSGVGDGIIRYTDQEVPRVPVQLSEESRHTPYTFCTLDFSARGESRVLKQAAGPYKTGDPVTVRAHATIGGRPEVRITGDKGQATVNPGDLAE